MSLNYTPRRLVRRFFQFFASRALVKSFFETLSTHLKTVALQQSPEGEPKVAGCAHALQDEVHSGFRIRQGTDATFFVSTVNFENSRNHFL